MSPRKKILVTGATGFVGANLVNRLVKENFEVHVIIRKDSNKWRLGDLEDLEEHRIDLLDFENLEKTVEKIKPEIIFHLAAVSVFSGIESDEDQLIKTNLFGAINLIRATRPINYQCFINTGSGAEYGLNNEIRKETDLCQPVSVYGIAKLAATQYASLEAKRYNKPILTLRLFSPYGPYDNQKRLISDNIIKALQNQNLELANPDAVRDYIYIDDVIDLYLKTISRVNDFKGEVFNVGSGNQSTSKEVIDKIIKITDSQSKDWWDKISSSPWDTKVWQADISKTRTAFDWRPKHNLEEGLKKTITWFKTNSFFYQ
ncbi:MAG: NAD(P)-dependent oxidoreductase [bacterium]